MDQHTVSDAHPGEDATILLDVGDQAARWRFGDRFAVPASGHRLVEGRYIPWADFNFGLLPFFHRHNRLIIVAPTEFDTIDGEPQVYQGKRLNTFMRSQCNSVAPYRQLLEMLAILNVCDCLPERRALIAIRASAIRGRSGPGQALLNAEKLAMAVDRLIRAWEAKTVPAAPA